MYGKISKFWSFEAFSFEHRISKLRSLKIVLPLILMYFDTIRYRGQIKGCTGIYPGFYSRSSLITWRTEDLFVAVATRVLFISTIWMLQLFHVRRNETILMLIYRKCLFLSMCIGKAIKRNSMGKRHNNKFVYNIK